MGGLLIDGKISSVRRVLTQTLVWREVLAAMKRTGAVDEEKIDRTEHTTGVANLT